MHNEKNNNKGTSQRCENCQYVQETMALIETSEVYEVATDLLAIIKGFFDEIGAVELFAEISRLLALALGSDMFRIEADNPKFQLPYVMDELVCSLKACYDLIEEAEL